MFSDFLLESFYLFGSFQGIVIVSLLVIRTRTRANMVLAILIALLSVFLLEQALFYNAGIREIPHMLFSTLPVTFLIGPVIYHFVRLNTRDTGWQWIHIIHLVPFTYELAILLPFYILPAEIKIAIYEFSQDPQRQIQFDRFSFGYLLYISSTLYFLVLSFNLLRQVKPMEKKDRKKRKVLKWIFYLLTAYLGFNLLLFVASFFLPNFTEIQKLSPLLLSVMIQVMGFMCYLNPDVISSEEGQAKYSSSALSNDRIENLSESLITVLEEKRLFLKQELKPKELADELGISTTNVSQVISKGLGTSFYNLINEHRVEQAKSLLTSEEYADAKLIHIALDSGFSNKSSFIRNFKRFAGVSPSEFRKKECHSIEWNT